MSLIAGWLPDGMGLASFWVMGVLVLVGACLQGIGGIGFAMFAAPVAALLFPVLLPGPLLLLGGLVSLMAALREPKSINWPIARACIVGRVLGAGLAAVIMLVLPPRPLSFAFGLLLLAGAGLTVAGWRFEPDRRNSALAGIVSGLMGTITSAGASPLGLLTQRLPPPAVRATVGCVIAVGGFASLAILWAAGHFNHRQLLLGLALFPWVLLGFLISSRLARRISLGGMRRMLLGLVVCSGLAVLAKAAWV